MMRKFNAIELVILIFAVSVSLVIIAGVLGMLFGGVTNADNQIVRTAIVDLIKFIVAGVFGAMGALKISRDKHNNN